jgi:hypothetical protein
MHRPRATRPTSASAGTSCTLQGCCLSIFRPPPRELQHQGGRSFVDMAEASCSPALTAGLARVAFSSVGHHGMIPLGYGLEALTVEGARRLLENQHTSLASQAASKIRSFWPLLIRRNLPAPSLPSWPRPSIPSERFYLDQLKN